MRKKGQLKKITKDDRWVDERYQFDLKLMKYNIRKIIGLCFVVIRHFIKKETDDSGQREKKKRINVIFRAEK